MNRKRWFSSRAQYGIGCCRLEYVRSSTPDIDAIEQISSRASIDRESMAGRPDEEKGGRGKSAKEGFVGSIDVCIVGVRWPVALG